MGYYKWNSYHGYDYRYVDNIVDHLRVKNMKKLAVILLLFIGIFQFGFAQANIKNPLTIGESIELQSTILNESRTINIYLPKSYSPDSTKRFPVIYLLDGSMDEDFIHVVGNVQFCSFSWINIIPETIVVGIGNIDRKKDFTYPSSVNIDLKEFPTSGKSANFIRFISEELQPCINKNYKTNSTSTIIGQSLGGLLATQILFEQPTLFQNYIIISPSLWWDNENILKWEFDKSLEGRSIYIGVGNEGPLMIRVAQSLFNKLSIDKSKEARLYYNYFDKQNHGDALHLAVYDAFEKMFSVKK